MKITSFTQIIVDKHNEQYMFDYLTKSKEWDISWANPYGDVAFYKEGENIEIPTGVQDGR